MKPSADGETTRVEQVMALVRQRIERRVLITGARLMSVRAMAESTGFSKSTVVEAYARLVAERVISPRAGSGFYVAAPLAPLSLAQLGPPLEREIDPLWMLRQSLTPGTAATLKPGCGWLPDDWMPHDVLRKGMRAIARARTRIPGYAPPLGMEPLRRLLARRLGDQDIVVSPDQVLLTDSGIHAIDLICRFFIEPGDVVLVDDPCYFNFHALLRAHRARIIGVPFTPNGPDITAFSQALTQQQKMDRAVKRLKVIGIRPWIEPTAGIFIWCELPDAIDAATVARRALADNIVLAPGNVFSVSRTAGSFMRFNAAMMDDADIFRVLQRAMKK